MRKLQASIFLIISAIILLGGITTYFLFSDDIDVFIDVDGEDSSVNYFITKCIEDTAKNSLNAIADKGGWYYSPNKDYAKSFKTDLMNRESKGVSYLNVIDIDYWFYYDDKTNSFVNNIPEYDTDSDYSIKNQIRRYVFDKLESTCIRNFYSLREIYDVNKKSDLKLSVELENEFIHLYIEYPLDVVDKSTEEKSFIESFYVKIPNTIVVPYNLAKDLVEANEKTFFLDKSILSILASYSTTENRNYLPPFYDFKMEFDKKPWNLDKTKEKAKSLLNINMGVLEFENTYKKQNSYLLSNEDFSKGVRDLFRKDFLGIFERSIYYPYYSRYDVKPVYETFFPSYISFTGNNEDILLMPDANSVLGILPIFFTTYKSSWDMTFPILFEIKDKDSDEFFQFKFFVETNIQNNLPLHEKLLNYGKLKTQISSLSNNYEGLICDEEAFVGNYSIEIFDSTKNSAVEDANVVFDCKGITSCHIGTSKIDSDGKSFLNFKLPRDCNPGKLEIIKNNHKTFKLENMNPNENSQINFGKVDMPSLKEFKLDFKIENFNKDTTGFIFFQNKETEETSKALRLTKENIDNLSVGIMPNTEYRIYGMMILNDTIIIPEDEICDESFIGKLSGSKCQKLESIEMEQWIVGNYELEDMFKSNILDKSIMEIEFNYIKPPSNYDDLQNLRFDEKSKEPVFR